MRLQFTLSAALLLGSSSAYLGPTDGLPIDLSTVTIPTLEQAAVQARKLLRAESIATLATVFPAGEVHGLEGQPFGIMDYYADCSSDGAPTVLGMKIATS